MTEKWTLAEMHVVRKIKVFKIISMEIYMGNEG